MIYSKNIDILLVKIPVAYETRLCRENTITDDVVYSCVRGRWRLNKERASSADYIFAVYKNVVVGVYSAAEWHNCDENDKNINPDWEEPEPDRIYFTRNETPSAEEIYLRGLFINKVIDSNLNSGQNPVSYCTVRYALSAELVPASSPENL